MPILANHYRVGVLGTQRTGKTTFLTSLINHLRHHDPREFPLGEGTLRIRFGGVIPNANDTPQFCYTDYREQLANRRWPGKTTDLSEYRCRLSLEGGSFWQRLENQISTTQLTLVDIPGERLADLGMVGRTYEHWSDSLLQLLEQKYDYLQECREYLALIEDGLPHPAEDYVRAYKVALARLVFKNMPVITPSTLTVTPTGEYVPRSVRQARDAAALAEAHHVGLDATRQFAPLGAEARAASPTVAATFAQHFAAYQTAIAAPLAEKFLSCDQLVILIDPTALLVNGVALYNGCRHMLQVALAGLAPGQSTLGKGLSEAVKILSLGHGRLPFVARVSQVAFVVSQADKVHFHDRDKLGDLVRQMTEPLLEEVVAQRWLTVRYFVASAVDSSVSLDYPELEVLPMDDRGRPADATRLIRVSPVPSVWPKTWAENEFFYPAFAPMSPDRADYPPTQFGLNRLLEFILGLQ